MESSKPKVPRPELCLVCRKPVWNSKWVETKRVSGELVGGFVCSQCKEEEAIKVLKQT